MAHKYNVGAYPFAGAFEHEGRDKTPKDHVLSGGAELMQLLEGQEAIVQQNVITRVAELGRQGDHAQGERRPHHDHPGSPGSLMKIKMRKEALAVIYLSVALVCITIYAWLPLNPIK
jgi:hypothetical protein